MRGQGKALTMVRRLVATAAAHHLVAVPGDEDRFVPRRRAALRGEQLAVAARSRQLVQARRTSQHRPGELRVASGAELDPVRACLAPDLRAPGLDLVDLVDGVDHRAARQQLAVVVAAVDTREDAINASPDVDRIVRDLVETMMPIARAPLGTWSSERLKRQEKADGRV